MAQVDVPSLLSKLIYATLSPAGLSEHDLRQRQPILLRYFTSVLLSSTNSQKGLDAGGDDWAQLTLLSRDLDAAGFDKAKLDRVRELAEALAPPSAGGRGAPGSNQGLGLGLPPRVRGPLLALLRKLRGEGRAAAAGAAGQGAGAAPLSGQGFGLTQSLQLGSLPPLHPAGASMSLPQPGSAPLSRAPSSNYGTQLPYGHNTQPYMQQYSVQSGPQPYVQQYPQSGQQPYVQQYAGQQGHQPHHSPRPHSVASSHGGGGPYGGGAGPYAVVRPTSVLTPSEYGDDPLSAEMSRLSYMGGGGGEPMRGPSRPGGAGGQQENVPPAGFFDMASEAVLVRDVLYAAQGVRGRHVGWGAKGHAGAAAGAQDAGQHADLCQGFTLDPGLGGVAPDKAALLERLTELGWLFRRVRASASDTGEGGRLRSALCAAFGAELRDYYRLLALLEGQAGRAGPDGAPALTLRRLACWLAEPMRRMRLLAALADGCRGLEGGPLAGAVHEVSCHGDPWLAANATKVLKQVCVPLYGMVRRWVVEGELDDPHGEFFVVQARHAAAAVGSAAAGSGGPPALDLWRSSYGVDPKRLPRFLSRPTALRVLRAGKAIHYLRLACGDGGWVAARAEAWARAPPRAAGGGEGQEEEELPNGLAALLSASLRSVDGRLRSVLWRRHRLGAHLAALRRFVLLGRGDWVTAFVDLAHRELDKPAAEVSEVVLNNCLRQALTATNVLGGGTAAAGAAVRLDGPAAGGPELYDDNDFGGGEEGGSTAAAAQQVLPYSAEEDAVLVGQLAERLRVRKERGASGAEVGWDVFRVTYNPADGLPPAAGGGGGTAPLAAGSGGPLGAIFTPAVMQSYQRLARLLWRLKRAEHALGGTWGAAACGLQRTVDKMGRDGAPAQPLLAALLRLRAEMGSFASSLQVYLHFEVAEAAWQDFFARAASCPDLDSLIAAHEGLLATLLRRALLEDPQDGRESSLEPCRRALQSALSNMVALRGVASRLEENLAGAARLLAARQQTARARVAAGGWGGSGGAAGGGGSTVLSPETVADLRRTLAELGAAHARAVAEFTERLPEEAQDDMRFLLARLDFSAKGTQAGQAASGWA